MCTLTLPFAAFDRFIVVGDHQVLLRVHYAPTNVTLVK
jgi:hypothetical protein